MSGILISTDRGQLDVSFINNFLSQTYWAKGRTEAETILAIEHSLNFGLYKNGVQIGYARVVSDFVQFAYLMDVFIAEEERGYGYGTMLVSEILASDHLEKVKVWRLATSDAHGLYKKFGFTALKEPGKMMELIRNTNR